MSDRGSQVGGEKIEGSYEGKGSSGIYCVYMGMLKMRFGKQKSHSHKQSLRTTGIRPALTVFCDNGFGR